MKIEFNVYQAGSNQRAIHYSKLLRALKKDSGCELYDESFEKWCKVEMGVIFLHGNEIHPSHLTGLEMDEATYTMLLLKYQLD